MASAGTPAEFTGPEWTEAFVSLLETQATTPQTAIDRSERLCRLILAFAAEAKQVASTIVRELAKSHADATVKPISAGGIAGGRKYIWNGILYKVANDDSKFYGSNEAAMKTASLELKGLMTLFNARVQGLSFPLVATVDVLGFRVMAQSLLPIDGAKTLVYGSADAGKHVATGDAHVQELMGRLAKAVNLAPHQVNIGKTIVGPVDLEVHKGKDGRIYVLDCHRVTPPELPCVQDVKASHLLHLLRPELLARWKHPLSSDAGCIFSCKGHDFREHCIRVAAATTHIRGALVHKVAAILRDEWGAGLPDARVPVRTFNSVTSLMHADGLNVRHLSKLGMAASKATHRSLILTEMAARAIKNISRGRLRQHAECGSSEATMVAELVRMLHALLYPSARGHAFLWREVYMDMGQTFGKTATRALLTALAVEWDDRVTAAAAAHAALHAAPPTPAAPPSAGDEFSADDLQQQQLRSTAVATATATVKEEEEEVFEYDALDTTAMGLATGDGDSKKPAADSKQAPGYGYVPPPTSDGYVRVDVVAQLVARCHTYNALFEPLSLAMALLHHHYRRHRHYGQLPHRGRFLLAARLSSSPVSPSPLASPSLSR